jgi:ribosomal-protein-alanine N-acetyltransferase
VCIQGQHVYIRRIEVQDAPQILTLRIRNRSFLKPFEPEHLHVDSQFTIDSQIQLAEQAVENWEKGLAYSFGIFLQDSDDLIGRVNLSNIVRGAWQNCTIGYFMDQAMNGRGYMTEAVRLAVSFAFGKAKLHRVQAAIMPRNIGSIRVIEKSGFRYEGLSKHYLQINGIWEDHKIFALTKEDIV